MSTVNFIENFCAGTLQECVQGFYNLIFALAVAVAFLFIIFGSFQYLTGAATNSKNEGKKKIISAITGLIIIFIINIVLNWINPGIFNAKLIIYRITNLEPPELRFAGGPFYPITSKSEACNRGKNIGLISYNGKNYSLKATKYYIAKESQKKFVNGSFQREVEINGTGFCDIGKNWICAGSKGKYARYTHKIASSPPDACGIKPTRGKTVALPKEFYPGKVFFANNTYSGSDTGSAIVFCEEEGIVRIDFFSGIGYKEYIEFEFPTGNFSYNKSSCAQLR